MTTTKELCYLEVALKKDGENVIRTKYPCQTDIGDFEDMCFFILENMSLTGCEDIRLTDIWEQLEYDMEVRDGNRLVGTYWSDKSYCLDGELELAVSIRMQTITPLEGSVSNVN